MENKLDALLYCKENAPEKMDAHFRELRKDQYVCLVPKGHPFEEKETLAIHELQEYPLIICNPLNAPLATAYLQQHILEQYTPQNVLYCNTIEIAHCMVASGMGISILPGMLCLKSPHFSTIPIDDKKQLSFGVFYRKQNTKAALKKLLRLISTQNTKEGF